MQCPRRLVLLRGTERYGALNPPREIASAGLHMESTHVVRRPGNSPLSDDSTFPCARPISFLSETRVQLGVSYGVRKRTSDEVLVCDCADRIGQRAHPGECSGQHCCNSSARQPERQARQGLQRDVRTASTPAGAHRPTPLPGDEPATGIEAAATAHHAAARWHRSETAEASPAPRPAHGDAQSGVVTRTDDATTPQPRRSSRRSPSRSSSSGSHRPAPTRRRPAGQGRRHSTHHHQPQHLRRRTTRRGSHGRAILATQRWQPSRPTRPSCQPSRTRSSITRRARRLDLLKCFNDPLLINGTQWHMLGKNTEPANKYGVNAASSWKKGIKGDPNVYVGIVDEGIDICHVELAPNKFVNYWDPINGIDDDHNGYIDDRYGWNFVDNNNIVFAGVDDHSTSLTPTAPASPARSPPSRTTTSASPASRPRSSTSRPSSSAQIGGTIAGAIAALDYLTDLKRRHGLKIVASNNSWEGDDSDSARAAGSHPARSRRRHPLRDRRRQRRRERRLRHRPATELSRFAALPPP